MSVAVAPLRDPRWLQIAGLSGLLAWGIAALHMDVRPANALAALGAALSAQLVWNALRREPLDPTSAAITGLSLSLLMRTEDWRLAALAGALAISSKFLLRAGGRHWFNPANFALAALLLAGVPIWISAGQWGSAALGAFALVCAGQLVVTRARRSDVTWAFLASWTAVLFGRALWLGDPLAIPLHQLESGALLLFSFFMISDPRSTPASRPGRIVFAVAVALVAGWIQFRLFRSNGLIWALFAVSLARPLIDALLPGETFHWPHGRGVHGEKDRNALRAEPRIAGVHPA